MCSFTPYSLPYKMMMSSSPCNMEPPSQSPPPPPPAPAQLKAARLWMALSWVPNYRDLDTSSRRRTSIRHHNDALVSARVGAGSRFRELSSAGLRPSIKRHPPPLPPPEPGWGMTGGLGPFLPGPRIWSSTLWHRYLTPQPGAFLYPMVADLLCSSCWWNWRNTVHRHWPRDWLISYGRVQLLVTVG